MEEFDNLVSAKPLLQAGTEAVESIIPHHVEGPTPVLEERKAGGILAELLYNSRQTSKG
tara:strand:- start:42 stop:218 length:177 start_codon:yes stop_codon:yes gene_type:complete